MRYKINEYCGTDRGAKKKEKEDFNEDYHLVSPDKRIFAVADGVGGHDNAAIASRIAAEHVCEALYESLKKGWLDRMLEWRNKDVGVEAKIRQAIQDANAKIYWENVEREGKATESEKYMCTTLSVVVLTDYKVYMAHMGNSRIYWAVEGERRIRKNRLELDDSPIMAKVDEILLKEGATEQEKREAIKGYLKNPYRNVVSRVLGIHESVEPTIVSYPVQNISHILMCTDGLTDNVTDDEIGAILRADKPENVVKRLIRLANNPVMVESLVQEICSEEGLKKEHVDWIKRGYKGNDNITAIVIRLEKE